MAIPNTLNNTTLTIRAEGSKMPKKVAAEQIFKFYEDVFPAKYIYKDKHNHEDESVDNDNDADDDYDDEKIEKQYEKMDENDEIDDDDFFDEIGDQELHSDFEMESDIFQNQGHNVPKHMGMQ